MAIADRCPTCGGVLLESDTDFRHEQGCILRFDSKESVIKEGIRKSMVEHATASMSSLIKFLHKYRQTLRTLRLSLTR